MESVAARWFGSFMEVIKTHEAGASLREAATEGRLKPWTQALTDIVVSTFSPLGWQGASKGHCSTFLPVARQEYLALDVVAFEKRDQTRWQFPTAVFELENSKSDDLVAYSLWKVLSVRAGLRVVFCYRRDAEAGVQLVRDLATEVVGSLSIPSRTAVGGETLVVVGSRAEIGTFPYGFFKDWLLNVNTGKFVRP